MRPLVFCIPRLHPGAHEHGGHRGPVSKSQNDGDLSACMPRNIAQLSYSSIIAKRGKRLHPNLVHDKISHHHVGHHLPAKCTLPTVSEWSSDTLPVVTLRQPGNNYVTFEAITLQFYATVRGGIEIDGDLASA